MVCNVLYFIHCILYTHICIIYIYNYIYTHTCILYIYIYTYVYILSIYIYCRISHQTKTVHRSSDGHRTRHPKHLQEDGHQRIRSIRQNMGKIWAKPCKKLISLISFNQAMGRKKPWMAIASDKSSSPPWISFLGPSGAVFSPHFQGT